MKALGTSIPGSFTTYTFTGLDQNEDYYAWILVVKGTNNSDAKASTPTFVNTLPYTIPIPTTPSNFVTSLATMTPGMFGGTGLTASPFTGL